MRRWENPYIAKSSEFSSSLLNCAENRFIAPAEEAVLLDKLHSYPKRYLEIGSGSGAFLIGLAKQNPDILVIGVELRYKRAVRTAEKAAKVGLKNLFVVRGSIDAILPILPPSSLHGVYINFPDPWDKKGWLKHRTLSPTFFERLKELLPPGARFNFKTDHHGYFQDTIQLIHPLAGYQLKSATYHLHASPLAEGNILTEFEQLFLKQKLPIASLSLERLA